MKNMTLAIEEDLLKEARKYALERNTTVNQLVRNYLAGIVKQKGRRRAAKRRLVSLMRDKKVEIGSRTWTREELYER